MKLPTYKVVDAAAGGALAWAVGSLAVDFGSPPFWLILQGVAVASAVICWASFLLSEEREALRWWALCGLIAGSFTTCAWLAPPTPACFFRLLLPLAARRAFELEHRRRWDLMTCGALVLLWVDPLWSDLFVCLALPVVAGEWYLAHRGLRWARGVAACLALPGILSILAMISSSVRAAVAPATYIAVLALLLFAAARSAQACQNAKGVHP